MQIYSISFDKFKKRNRKIYKIIRDIGQKIN